MRSVQFDFPRQDAWILQKLPGMADFDNHLEVLDLVKALWGLKDAPRAFGLKLAETLRSCDFVQGIVDPQAWRKFAPGHQSKQDNGHIGNSAPWSTSDLLSETADPASSSNKRQAVTGEEIMGEICCLSDHHTH